MPAALRRVALKTRKRAFLWIGEQPCVRERGCASAECSRAVRMLSRQGSPRLQDCGKGFGDRSNREDVQARGWWVTANHCLGHQHPTEPQFGCFSEASGP